MLQSKNLNLTLLFSSLSSLKNLRNTLLPSASTQRSLHKLPRKSPFFTTQHLNTNNFPQRSHTSLTHHSKMPSYKDVCTDAELNRFACCLMHLKDGGALSAVSPPLHPTTIPHFPAARTNNSLLHPQQVDWGAAAADYDPKVKVASFKTVTMKAFKKAWGAVHPEEGSAAAEGEGEADSKAKGKVKGAGRKRKAAAVVAGEDGEGEGKPAAKKTRGGKRGKKAAAEVEDGDAEEEDGGAEEEEEHIKAETDDGGFDDFA